MGMCPDIAVTRWVVVGLFNLSPHCRVDDTCNAMLVPTCSSSLISSYQIHNQFIIGLAHSSI